jgi:hypothetical protein
MGIRKSVSTSQALEIELTGLTGVAMTAPSSKKTQHKRKTKFGSPVTPFWISSAFS